MGPQGRWEVVSSMPGAGTDVQAAWRSGERATTPILGGQGLCGSRDLQSLKLQETSPLQEHGEQRHRRAAPKTDRGRRATQVRA